MGGLPHGREQQLTLAGKLTTYQPLNVGNRDCDNVGGMGTGQPLDVAWILAVAASSTDAPLGPPTIIRGIRSQRCCHGHHTHKCLHDEHW